MITRMEQLADVAVSADHYKVPTIGEIASTTSGEQRVGLIAKLVGEGILTASTMLRNDAVEKSGSDTSVKGFAQALINEAEQFIEFLPTLGDGISTLFSNHLDPSIRLTTVVDGETQKTLDGMNRAFESYLASHPSDLNKQFSFTEGDCEYTSGPHGERYVFDKSTHIETIDTVAADGTHTVVTKMESGEVHGFTSQYSFTMNGPDKQKILTITTKGEPPQTVKLIENGSGFDVILDSDDPSFPPAVLHLRDAADVAKFDLLMQHMIAMNVQDNHLYTKKNLYDDFYDSRLTAAVLMAQYKLLGQLVGNPVMPLSLVLGSADGSAAPSATLSTEGGVPITYDFDSGDVSIGGTPDAPDFVFHVDRPTDGTAFGLLMSTSGLTRGGVDKAIEDQQIAAAKALAASIVSEFQYNPSVNPYALIGQLLEAFGRLNVFGTPAASFAQADISSALNSIYAGMSKLNENPLLDNPAFRTDVLNGVLISEPTEVGWQNSIPH